VKRAIFISYRRDDAEGEAGRLYDDLVRVYGDDSVFMDVAGIAPGLDFRKAIDDNVSGCGVFLAVIGPEWATITDTSGQRRLDEVNDFVRLEIASALTRNIAVIPVLVHEARMPHPDQLPDNIKDFAYRNSVELSHPRWNSDVQLLIKALKQYVTISAETETEPVHATVPVQLPPPVSNEPAAPVTKSRLPIVLGVGATVVLLAVIGFFVLKPKPAPVDNTVTPAPVQSASAEEANVLTGNWQNSQPKSGEDALVALRIDGSGPGYNVVPYGKCPQGECSWGLRTVILSGGRATGEWTPQITQQDIDNRRTVTLTLRPLKGSLSVLVQNTGFSGADAKPRSSESEYIFVRQK
jgi:hypothetical protein